MSETYDLVVIGTGSAGATAAYRCREADWEVAIVDSRPYGGTCALRGCDPKKVLLGAAELVDWHRRMAGSGVVGAGVGIDWPTLMRFKRSFTESVPADREEGYAGVGISTFHGQARFADEHTLLVGDTRLNAERFLIAAGAEPLRLGIPGEELVTPSEDFLDMERLPGRIVFVGGGYISMEFAHLARRAGAEVYVIHKGPQLLEGFDPDLTEQLTEATRALGVDVRLLTDVVGVESGPDGLLVRVDGKEGSRTISADMVVHGAGRVPEIEALDLSKAGVEYERRGVLVNRYLQSISNPRFYAAGDAAASPGLPLTPVAGAEGGVAADNMLNGNHTTADYSGVPTVVFTIPPLASVGLSEEAARESGLRFRTTGGETSGWYTSHRVAEKHSGFKVLIEEESDLVVGAHLLGPHAEEVINAFALAVRFGIKAGELKKMLFAYPTATSDLTYMVG